MRKMKYLDAEKWAVDMLLSKGDVLAVGNCVAVPGFLDELQKKYGEKVFDYPLSEASNAGFAVGTAMMGFKPIVFFARFDFALYAMDGLINEALYWSDVHGGCVDIPLIAWMKVKRGGGAQHSASYESWFMHLPKTTIFAPSNAYQVAAAFFDAYYLSGFKLIVDDALLWNIEGEVPEEEYRLDLKSIIHEEGDDVTIVSYGGAFPDAVRLKENLKREGCSVELIDLFVLKPLDIETIAKSVKKTGRLITVENSWKYCGVGSEILAQLKEMGIEFTAKRLTLPEIVAPAATHLLKKYLDRVSDFKRWW